MTKIEDAQKQIKTKIKNALKEKKMSQTELAKEIGVDKTAISHYLNSDRIPRADVLLSICETLDISLDSIVGKKTTINMDSSEIPSDPKSIIYATAILLKNGVIFSDEERGEFWVTNSMSTIYPFIEDAKRFIGSSYKKVDEVIIDLVDTYVQRWYYVMANPQDDECLF